jgi:TonB family protein
VAPVTPPDPVPAPVPIPEPISADDLPLRVVEPARQLEWDRPRMEYGTQRVPIERPAPEPAKPAPPVVAAPPPAPVAPAQSAGSRFRWVLILAGIAGIAVLGGAIGAFLGRGGSDDARPASPAAASEPAPAVQAPAEQPSTPEPAQVVEIAPKPEPHPPPVNEKAEPVAPPPVRRLPPPMRVPEEAVIKAPTGPMQRGELIVAGPGVEYPEPATEISAAYPTRAVESRRSAKVRVAVLVDENGNVVQTRIREGDPSGLGFNESAQEAARRARFLPATRDGVPGKFWTELIYEFEPPAAAPPEPAPESPPSTPPARLR